MSGGEEELPLDSVYTSQQWTGLHTAIFNESKALESLRDYARATGVAPVALLVTTLTRLAALSYPVTVDVGLGPTPLNLFTVLVGDSGAGKDLTIRRAGAYRFTRNGGVVEPIERPLGSGESLVSAFIAQPEKKGEGVQIEHRALFTETEVSNADTLMRRDGSTLRQNLLKIYSGSGFGSATKEQVHSVDADSYSAGLIIGAQRAKVGALLDRPDDGLPHRFVWAELVDPHRPDVNRLYAPNEVALPEPGTVIEACDEAKAEFNSRKKLRLTRGYTGGLESHSLLTRARIAALLSILRENGNSVFTDDDWGRAGALMDYSRHVRESCVDAMDTVRTIRAMEKAAKAEETKDQKVRESFITAFNGKETVRVSPIKQHFRRARENADSVLAEMLETRAVVFADEHHWSIRRGDGWDTYVRKHYSL